MNRKMQNYIYFFFSECSMYYVHTISSSLLCLENAHRWFVLPPVIQELYVIMMKAKHLEIQLKMKIECHDPMSTLAYCILKFKNEFPWKYRYMFSETCLNRAGANLCIQKRKVFGLDRL
jgi:hypothetical protein